MRTPVAHVYFRIMTTAGAVAVGASLLDLSRHPPSATWYLLLALTFVTGVAALRLRDVPVSFSISDTFTIGAALLYGAPAATVTVAVDAVAMSIGVKRADRDQWRQQILFNATAPAFTMWATAFVVFRAAGLEPVAPQQTDVQSLIVPLAVFAVVYFFTNTGAVAVMVALHVGKPIRDVWVEAFAPLWLTYCAGASLAGVLALLTASRIIDVTTLALILPLVVVLHLTYRAALSRLNAQLDQLRETAVLAEALRSTADAVIVVDDQDRVTFINPAASALTGWDDHDARQLPLPEVFAVRAERTQREQDVDEQVLSRQDGTERIVEVRRRPVHQSDGRNVGAVITFNDVTRRRLLDAEREALLDRAELARDMADTASQLKDQFLRALSHELRTPLAVVLGWVRILRHDEHVRGKWQRALDAIERNASQQAAVVDALLDTASAVRGTFRLEMQLVDVSQLMDDAIAPLKAIAEAKGVTVTLHAVPDDTTLMGDRSRLRQVVRNVVSNAVKFSGPGTTVDVQVTAESDTVRMDVVDQGRGIEPESLPRVFDWFRQLDGSRKRAHGGLGVGLAIVRHIVHLHEGTVAVESAGVNLGVRVTIVLPRRPRTDPFVPGNG